MKLLLFALISAAAYLAAVADIPKLDNLETRKVSIVSVQEQLDKLADEIDNQNLPQLFQKVEYIQKKINALDLQVSRDDWSGAINHIYWNLDQLHDAVFEDASGYAVEDDDDEDTDEDEGDESLAKRLLKRFQTRLTNSLEKVKDLISHRKEIAEEFTDKIKDIATGIADLGKQTGRKLRENARQLAANIVSLNKAILAKIGIGSGYAAEDDEDIDESDENDGDESLVKRLLKRFQTRLTNSLEKVKDLISHRKEIAEEFTDKIKEIATGIADLGKQTGRKMRENARKLAANIVSLNKAILAKIGIGSGYAAEDIDDEDIDESDENDGDESLAKRLLKRFQTRLTNSLEKVKELISHRKEIAEEFTDKIKDIATGIADLGKQTGRKLRENARQLAANIVSLNKAILAKIGIGSGYAAEDDDDDEKEIDESTGDESLAKRLLKRFQTRLTNSLEKVKELIAHRKEIAEEFTDKIKDIATRISELGKLTGRKMLDKVREITAHIVSLNKAILAKIGIGSGYVAEDEDEKEIEESIGDESLAKRLLKRFQTRLTNSLEKVKELIANRKEIAEEFTDKIKEIAGKIGELGKATGRKLLDKVREITANIVSLNKAILAKIGIGSGYAAEDEDEKEIEESIGDESLAKRLLKRFQTRLSNALERVKELIGNRKEIAEEFTGKIVEIANRIGDLGKLTGRKLLEKVRELTASIVALNKAILAKIGIGGKYHLD